MVFMGMGFIALELESRKAKLGMINIQSASERHMFRSQPVDTADKGMLPRSPSAARGIISEIASAESRETASHLLCVLSIVSSFRSDRSFPTTQSDQFAASDNN